MILLLIIYMHSLSCLIYYIMNLNRSWLPPSETYTSGIGYYELDDLLWKYCTVLYYAVLMYLINETAPTVLYERIFVQIVAVISAIVNAIIFGTISNLISDLNKKQVEFQ